MEYFKKNVELEIKKTLENYNNFLNQYKFSLALASLDNIKKLLSNAKGSKIKIPKYLLIFIYELEKKITTNDFYKKIICSEEKNYPYRIAKPYLIIKKFNKN